jgi:hypothetical protein
VLLVDSAINLVLGGLLLFFPRSVVDWLGVPASDVRFYPSLLGAVLVGIGIALIVQWRRTPNGPVGLGLGGAIAINLVAGAVLAGWLLFGGLHLPVRGCVFLWALVVLLVTVSALEAVIQMRERRGRG